MDKKGLNNVEGEEEDSEPIDCGSLIPLNPLCEVDNDDYHFIVMLMLVMSTKCLRLLLLLLVVHLSSK